jgi:acyl carrier protein
VLPDTAPRIPSRTEIDQRVKGIVSEQLSVALDELPNFATFVDAGADLLDMADIAIAIDDGFGLSLEPSVIDELIFAPTVGQLCDLVEGAVKAGGIS